MSWSLRVELRDHPGIVALAEELESAALNSLAAEAETLVAGAIPVVGPLLKPVIGALINKAVSEINAATAAALTKWLNEQPGFVTPGDGHAGLISLAEVDDKTGVATPLPAPG